MRITTIILLVTLFMVIKIHININKGNSKKKTNVVPANSSSNGNTNSNSNGKKDIKDIKKKQKIKDKPKKEEVKTELNQEKEVAKNGVDELVKDTAFAITEERLASIEKDEEEQELLKAKLKFKSSMEDEVLPEEEVEVDYDQILNNEFKIELAEEIQSIGEFKWYDDPNIKKESNVEIPTKEYKVMKYNY